MLATASACATTGEGQTTEAKSEIDRAVGRCAASVIGGALLGAIIGNNTGRGNAGRGALIGASAGGLACTVIMAAAREKAALLDSQRAAIAAGADSRQEIRAKDGSTIVMNNRITEAPSVDVTVDGAVQSRRCKFANSTIEIADIGASELGVQKYCQSAEGTWELA
jgi:hypothetical protein